MNKTVGRIALAGCFLDLLTKLLLMGKEGVLIPGVLAWQPVMNSGVAFGLMSASPLFNAALSALIILLLAWFARANAASGLYAIGLGLLLGGATGNLLDRLLHGAVSDAIQTLFIRFPVFNLADVFVTLGAGLLILMMLFSGKEAF